MAVLVLFGREVAGHVRTFLDNDRALRRHRWSHLVAGEDDRQCTGLPRKELLHLKYQLEQKEKTCNKLNHLCREEEDDVPCEQAQLLLKSALCVSENGCDIYHKRYHTRDITA